MAVNRSSRSSSRRAAHSATQNTVTRARTVWLSQCTLSSPAVAVGRAAWTPECQRCGQVGICAATQPPSPHTPSVFWFQRLQLAACRPAPARCVRLTWQMYFIGFCSAASFFSAPSMMWDVQVPTCGGNVSVGAGVVCTRWFAQHQMLQPAVLHPRTLLSAQGVSPMVCRMDSRTMLSTSASSIRSFSCRPSRPASKSASASGSSCWCAAAGAAARCHCCRLLRTPANCLFDAGAAQARL